MNRIANQDNKQTSTTATIVVAYPFISYVGDLLIITVLNNAGVGATASGFTAYSAAIDGGNSEVTILYKISTGEQNVTVTCTGATVIQAHGYEYVGPANPVAIDTEAKRNSGTATQTSYSTAAITTTLSADLVFSSIGAQLTMGGSENWATSQGLQQSTKLLDGEYDPQAILTNWSDTVSGIGSATQLATLTIAFESLIATNQYLSLLGVGS